MGQTVQDLAVGLRKGTARCYLPLQIGSPAPDWRLAAEPGHWPRCQVEHSNETGRNGPIDVCSNR